MKKYYLAYGSNLNIRQMSWRCFDASVIGTTTLSGYRLAYKGTGNGSSYLTIEESKDHYVPLGVYEISLEDEKNLDIYEGYPTFYRKEYFSLIVGGKKIKAMIYVMNDEFSYHLPSKSYVKTCEQGYSHFGFDTNLLQEALEYSKNNKVKSLKR